MCNLCLIYYICTYVCACICMLKGSSIICECKHVELLNKTLSLIKHDVDFLPDIILLWVKVKYVCMYVPTSPHISPLPLYFI